MRPGRLIVALAVAWALVGLGVSLAGAGEAMWRLAGGVLLAVLALDGVWLLSERLPRVTRTLPRRLALGEPGEVTLEVVNRAGRALVVELFDGIPEGAEAESMPWRGRVVAGGRLRVTHRVRCCERGVARFRPVHARMRSALRLWWRPFRRGKDEEVRVYPDYEPVVRFTLLAMDAGRDPLGLLKRRRAGSSREFHQLRGFREGDSLAQVDWKASSRRRELLSRDYEEQRDQTIVFLLDTGRRMRALDGELPQFDHCLNAMLLLSYVALRQGDAVGVLSFGGTNRWLPPVKGAHSMSVILNHLFDYRTSTQPSDFAAGVERLQVHQPRRALVVMLTNLRGEDGAELVPALRSAVGRHLVLLASLRERSVEEARRRPVGQFHEALRFAAAEEYDRERREVLAELEEFGVLTLDVPAQELPLAMANRYLRIKAAGRL